MKLFSNILLAFFLLSFLSCNNKKSEQIQSIASKDSTTISLEKNKFDLSTQEGLYAAMVHSMSYSDLDVLKKHLKDFKNIDTLFVDGTDENGESELSLLGRACSLNNLEAVKYLISQGADIRIGGTDGYFAYDAMYYTIGGGNVEMLKILIDNKADVNAIYTEAGITPLVLAVQEKKYVMAELLLEKGANVNGGGYLGFDYVFYPLHEAIDNDDEQMVKLLLKYQANVKLKAINGQDAIDLSEALQRKNITKILNESLGSSTSKSK